MNAEIVINRHTHVNQLSPGTLLNQEEVAVICRVQPETVKKWRATKKGPRSIPIARERLYKAGDVAAWIDGLRG